MLKSSENDDANMTAVSKELQTFAHQSLLLALSEISSPIITLLFFILQILSSIWALVFTVKFLKKDAPKLLRAAKIAAVTWNLKHKFKRKTNQCSDKFPPDDDVDDDDDDENRNTVEVPQPRPGPRISCMPDTNTL